MNLDYLKNIVTQYIGSKNARRLQALISHWGRYYFAVHNRYLEPLLARNPFALRTQKKVRPCFKIAMAVLVHERPEYLEICLDSLFRTKLYDYDITFLLHDDGSTDSRVREILERKRQPEYRIVRHYEAQRHGSWGGAFNSAIRRLLGIDDFDIIGSCDADALFHPEWLDQTMKICLWAKEHHRDNILGPFSSFNSSDFLFHKLLGTYESPEGKYVVKERMGALNYFYFREDFLKLGFFEEHSDDETRMTERFKRLRVRNFCTETSYVEHIGQVSLLDMWRQTPVGNAAAFAVKPVRDGWVLPESATVEGFPYLRLQNCLVLHIRHGGLGDHLFHSHLPRIAKESGRYRKVYVSNLSSFRSEEIKRLVWEYNPYIDGFCDEACLYPEPQTVRKGYNLLDEILLQHDIDDGRRLHEPEIYYQPKVNPEVAGKILYDPNYISNAGNVNSVKVEQYFCHHTVSLDLQMKILSRKAHSVSFPLKTIEAQSLEDFCDILFSCGGIYCLVTGTATLAAALGKTATVLYDSEVGKMFLHSPNNRYVKL